MFDDDRCEFLGCNLEGRFTDPSLDGKWCEHHRRVKMDGKKAQAHADEIKKLEEERDSWRRIAERLQRELDQAKKSTGRTGWGNG